jgi:predicted nuclease of predicted toxin-antitoxin system
MNPLAFPLLADENLDPAVVAELRSRGHDVQTVSALGLGGSTDRALMRLALGAGRVIITHDSDFGALAIRDGEPLLGIIHLRPGHIQASVVLSMLDTILSMPIDAKPPFLLVADRRGRRVRVRLRRS